MGRYYGYGSKEELAGLLWIDASKLKGFGYFQGVYRGGTLSWTHRPSGHQNRIGIGVSLNETDPHMRLEYTTTRYTTGEKVDFDYRVRLTSTKCNYGGHRWWFICPLVTNGTPCRRRVRKLYKSGDYFGCRICQNLCYPDQNLNRRHSLSRLMRIIESEKRAEELLVEIRLRYYNGQPSKMTFELSAIS